MSKTPSQGWTDRGIITAAPTIGLGAMIGRFQFFHDGHLDAIIQGARKCQNIALLIGSSFQPRTYFNPFSFEEREEIILNSLPEDLRGRVRCYPLEDATYNNNAWILNVQDQVEEARQDFGLPENVRIGLVGHKKDGTSYYLNMFPQWEEVAVTNTTGLSATPLRETFFLTQEPLPLVMPQFALDWLTRFEEANKAVYERIRAEYVFVANYKDNYAAIDTSLVPASWLRHAWVQRLIGWLRAKPKYPPIFQTVDACVVQSGHVLLVQRKEMPGQGLWALPGGFLQADERIEDGVYRELREETKIEVPEGILRGRTEEIRYFDNIHRSARGRTITHCALINLQTPVAKRGERVKLPRVKGSDDAKRAKWFPLKGPGSIHPEWMFEDHYSIIKALTAKL